MTISVRMVLAVSVLAVIAPARLTASVGAGDRPAGNYASDRIIVQLSRPAHERARQWAWGRGFRSQRITTDPTPALGRSFQTETRRWRMSRMRPMYFEEFANPAAAAKHGLDRIYILDVPPGTDTAAMAGAFRQLSDEVEVAAVDAELAVAGEFIPNDSSFSFQWALRNGGQFIGSCGGSPFNTPCHNAGDCSGGSCSNPQPTGSIIATPDADIDASEAWLMETSLGSDVTVAIIDSGVDPHPDFGARLLPGQNTHFPNITPKLTTDDCPHGTHVAGIAAAGGHNGVGGAGVAWGVNILPVRVLDGCVGNATGLINGVLWAADNGADIANFSLQYYDAQLNNSQVTLLQNSVDYATEQGMLLVSATGNNNFVVAYPARLRNVIAVGGTDAMDRRATQANAGWTSNFGPQIDVVAPGDDIYATWINDGYRYHSGTSMATPHVTGVAALIKAASPELGPLDIGDILTIAVEDLGSVGWDLEYGYGRINAAMAVNIAAAWPKIQSTPANRAVDARQPTDSLGFENYGWDSIEVVSTPDVVAGLTVESIAVEQRCNPSFPTCGTVPQVLEIVPIDLDRAIVVLDRRINLQAWTRIQPDAGSLVRLAFLPADVNGDQVSTTEDLVELIGELPPEEDPEYQPSLPEWSLDIDRSTIFTSLDVLTCIDLLNGADAHTKWLDKKLEPGVE